MLKNARVKIIDGIWKNYTGILKTSYNTKNVGVRLDKFKYTTVIDCHVIASAYIKPELELIEDGGVTYA